ncbi:MAG: NAD-dependent epimerase/dehydratase family protein [Planctomycetota bacterium]
MRVCITGGTGFTGSQLVRRYIDQGHDVVVLDNQPGLFADELQELGADVQIGSVTDKDAVDRVTEGAQLVQHVAAAFRKLNVPDTHYWDVNVEGTRNVCDACVRYSVPKLVYCSTIGVHGHVTTGSAHEDSPIAPADYYQQTKYNGEEVVQDFVQNGLDATIVRPSAIYGPGDPGRFLMLFKLCKRGTFYMFGDGQTHYHPVHIENLCDSFQLAATTPNVTGEVFIGADDHSVSLNDLVHAVAKAMDKDVKIVRMPFAPLRAAAVVCEAVCKPLRISPPLFPRRVDWFRQHRSFDIAKARRVLGYEPRVDLATGLRQTAAWYKEFGYLDGHPSSRVRLPERLSSSPVPSG